MRGLPSAGKSYRAKELAGENGVIFSTDEYYYKMNKPSKPDEYSFHPRMLAAAHKWNQLRAQRAFDLGDPKLIIIDNTNTTMREFCCSYAKYAHFQGYKICIEEPTSDQWSKIRPLLLRKKQNEKELKKWAAKLAEMSLETHGVPAWSIERMMWRFQPDLDIETVLSECIETHVQERIL